MATRPAGKKFRSGTLGELADDIYTEIEAVAAGATTWDGVVDAAAGADKAIDFNNQQITGVNAAGGIGQEIAAATAALAVVQAGVAVAAAAEAGGDVAANQASIVALNAKINEIRTALVAAGILA